MSNWERNVDWVGLCNFIIATNGDIPNIKEAEETYHLPQGAWLELAIRMRTCNLVANAKNILAHYVNEGKES